MRSGILGIMGSKGRWGAIIEAAYATKMSQATQKSTGAKKVAAPAKSVPQNQTAKNRATLAAVLRK